MHKCTKCRKNKDIKAFSKDTRCPLGIRSECRACVKLTSQSNYTRNHSKRLAQMANYKKSNPGKINALAAKRHASKLERTPKWLTSLQLQHIQMFYDSAAALAKEFGIQMDVDHIIPLQGKNVSGLHVPWNLQVITAKDNASKSNRLTA